MDGNVYVAHDALVQGKDITIREQGNLDAGHDAAVQASGDVILDGDGDAKGNDAFISGAQGVTQSSTSDVTVVHDAVLRAEKGDVDLATGAKAGSRVFVEGENVTLTALATVEATAGTVSLKATATDGVLSFHKCQVSGDQVNLEGDTIELEGRNMSKDIFNDLLTDSSLVDATSGLFITTAGL